MPFGCGPHERYKVYYKGEGGGFPQVRAVVSFVNPSLPVVSPVSLSMPMVSPSTKNVPTMH
jgi:hypothetical protein